MAAGYQMRKGILPSIFTHEMEPGHAMAHVANTEFPFNATEVLPPSLLASITRIAPDPAGLTSERYTLLAHWRAEAARLAPDSIAALKAIPDPQVRELLYRGDRLGECEDHLVRVADLGMDRPPGLCPRSEDVRHGEGGLREARLHPCDRYGLELG